MSCPSTSVAVPAHPAETARIFARRNARPQAAHRHRTRPTNGSRSRRPSRTMDASAPRRRLVMRAPPALCILSILAGSLPAQRPVSKRAAILDLTAAIVLEDMTVRSLPQLALDVKWTSDSTKTTLIRTDLTGHATRELPAGSYLVQSQQSATLGSHRYSVHSPARLTA